MIGGRYHIKEPLGHGGMGIIYKGIDTSTNDVVAIKKLKSSTLQPDLVERFRREGEALRSLDHPNIVKFFDMFQEHNVYYLIMEYVPGGDLEHYMKQNSLSIKSIISIVIEIAEALALSHHHHIIHRDIKPANILITDQKHVRVTDFGIALVQDQERLTETGGIIGTIDYMSPEAIQNEKLDARSDIWSLGVILFEMLSGMRPFTGSNMIATLQAIAMKPIPDLEALCPEASSQLIDLIYRMLDKNPDARIPTMQQVGLELESITLDREHTPVPSKFLFVNQETSSTIIFHQTNNNLPAQPTPFIGREAEINHITSLLNTSEVRLITILAQGGMGKSRLAIEVGLKQVDAFADGVLLVELVKLAHPEAIIDKLAEVLGFQFQPGNTPRETQLIDFLSNKQVLLIMDNWEHILEGAPIVNRILSRALGVKILATSRQLLNQPGETVVYLSGMDYPHKELSNETDYSDAVDLFVSVARRILPSYQLNSDDVEHIVQICKLVEGMPLGIVLAASWVNMLTPAEIVSEIQHSISFLEADTGGIPERQRSIQVIADYAWKTLSEQERHVFIQLAVFRSGFTREAAEIVAGANLRILRGLMNKSMLQRNVENGRFRIHELLRQYGLIKLKEASIADDEIYQRHSHFYTQFVADRKQDVYGLRQLQALQEMDPELENIRVAWRWAVNNQMLNGLRNMAQPFAMFHIFRGRFLELESELEFSIQAINQMFKNEDRDLTLALLLCLKAMVEIRLGKLANTEQLFQISLNLYDAYNVSPPSGWQADPVMGMSLLKSIKGDYQEAERLAQQVQKRALQRKDLPGLQTAYYVATSAYFHQGDIDNAQYNAEQALTISEQLGDQWQRSEVLNDLGKIARLKGKYDLASDCYRRSYEFRKTFSDAQGMGAALNQLGLIEIVNQDYQEAQRMFDKAHYLFQKISDRGGIGYALVGLALAHIGLATHELARNYLLKSIDIATELSYAPFTFWVLIAVGEYFLQTNNIDRGIEILTFVRTHQNSDKEAQDRAKHLLANLSQTGQVTVKKFDIPQLMEDLKYELVKKRW